MADCAHLGLAPFDVDFRIFWREFLNDSKFQRLVHQSRHFIPSSCVSSFARRAESHRQRSTVHSQARRFFPRSMWPNVSPAAPHTRALKRPDTLTPSSIHHRCWRQTLPLRRSVVQIVWLRGLERHENRRFLPQKSVFSVRPRCHRAASGQPP